jgi:hypothetical protein
MPTLSSNLPDPIHLHLLRCVLCCVPTGPGSEDARRLARLHLARLGGTYLSSLRHRTSRQKYKFLKQENGYEYCK